MAPGPTKSTPGAARLARLRAPLPDHDEYLARRHFAGLDGVRCLSIIAVVWHHSSRAHGWPILERGFFGVDLFFILSGYLISTLLIREKRRSGRISLGDFWMRRLLRLAPAYYLLLAGMAFTYLVLKPHSPNASAVLHAIPASALYASNWVGPRGPNLGHTWSLATEEQFYLVWPLVESFLRPVGAALVWAGAILVNQLVNFRLVDPQLSAMGLDVVHRLEIVEATYSPILIGVAAAHLLDSRAGHRALSQATGFPGAGLVYGAAVLVVLNTGIVDIYGWPRFLAQCLSAMFVVALVLRPASVPTRIMELPTIRYVGLISYGIYLYHMLCLHAARAVAAKIGMPAANFPIGLAFSIACASASYFVFERHFLTLRGRFRRVRTIVDDHGGSDQPNAVSAPANPSA